MSREGSTAGLTSVVRSGSGTGRRERALVVGGHVGRTVASDLNGDYDVTFVSRNPHVVDHVTRDDVTAHHVEEVDNTALDEAGAADVSLAVVASGDDVNNFLVAQLLRTRFDVEHIVIRVDDSEKLGSFEGLDIETVCVPDLLADEVIERLETVADDVTDG